MRRSFFHIVEHRGEAQPDPGEDGCMHDHYEWLSLTIGRFLAAPASDPTRPGRASFLLPGPTPAGPDVRDNLGEEIEALEQGLDSLAAMLQGEIGRQGQPRQQVLASLATLLELRLPDPANADCVHLHDGLLYLSGWGMAGGPATVRVGDLLGKGGRAARKNYLATLQTTVLTKYGAARGVEVSSGARRSPVNDYVYPAAPSAGGRSEQEPRTLGERLVGVLMTIVVGALQILVAMFLWAVLVESIPMLRRRVDELVNWLVTG